MPYDELPDEQLVVLVTRGEHQAFAALYDRHGKAVFGLAIHMLRDRLRAEEVSQEVFLDVWRNAAAFRPEKGSFHTWLMAISHHRVVDELRRHRRRETTLEEAGREALVSQGASLDSPDTEALRSEEAQAVRKALDGLPSEQCRVVEMAYYHGLTQSEIAQRLQQPLGTVKTRMRLAMQKLRAALAAYKEGV